jgi:DNA-binding CsgD family transcriptional regulator
MEINLISISLADQALCRREMEIIRLLSKGLKSKEIAEEPGISVRTVKNHRKKIIKKYGSNSTNEIIQLGVEQGWL